MLSVKALKEKQGSIHDKATAIVNLAKKEKRDLTEAEKTEFDGHMAAYNAIAKDDLPRAEWLEGEEARLAGLRNATPIQRSDNPGEGDGSRFENRAARVIIPAQSRHRHGQLKAFKGENAERAAFLAGQFYLATLCKNERAAQWCNDHGIDIKFRGALKEAANELGGFLTPEEVESTIINLREDFGLFRRKAHVYPMGSDTKRVPKRTGGVTAYFVNEGTAGTESDKGWGNVGLVAKKLMALIKYSSEVSEDAIIDLGDDLTKEIAHAFAYKEDFCGFVGDGGDDCGHITGIVNAVLAGSIHTALAGNTGFETLDMVDFEACVGKLPDYPGIQPEWYISKAGYAASMLRLMDAAGGTTGQQIADGIIKPMFLGYPVNFAQVMNKTLGADASKPKAIFGDVNMGCAFGSRRGMSVKASEHRYIDEDNLCIVGTERFDINVHETGTASEAGALIVLKTPGS